MAVPTAATLTWLLRALRLAPGAVDQVQRWQGKPTKEDRELLISYAQRLDERRLFYVPFDVEAIECCIGSLASAQAFTEETLEHLRHEGAKAMLGGIFDALRRFLDRWRGFRTPDAWGRYPHFGRDEQQFPEFFQDLGRASWQSHRARRSHHLWRRIRVPPKPDVAAALAGFRKELAEIDGMKLAIRQEITDIPDIHRLRADSIVKRLEEYTLEAAPAPASPTGGALVISESDLDLGGGGAPVPSVGPKTPVPVLYSNPGGKVDLPRSGGFGGGLGGGGGGFDGGVVR